MRFLVLAALAAGCCVASPSGVQAEVSTQQTPAPTSVPDAPVARRECSCLADLKSAEAVRSAPAPKSDPAPETGSSTETLIRVVTGAGGILTGNPPAWALAGQLAYLALGLFRRKPKA